MRPVVVVVDPDPHRLQARQAVLRRQGCLALPAPTVRRAHELWATVRPTLVLAAQPEEGEPAALLRQLRAAEALGPVPLAVLGPLSPQERHTLASDPLVHVREGGDEAALRGLVAEVLGQGQPHPD